MALAGAATDDGTLTEVRWANNRGGSGVATGTNRWTVDRAALQAGANEITITARDAAGNTASARLVVTATDRQAPTVRITGPAPSDTFSTSARIINLEGTATDDFGVTQIAWASDRGTSGVARGTGSWIAGGVALQPGVNVIAVTALDAAGNSSSDVLRITVDCQLPVVTITSPSSSTFNERDAERGRERDRLRRRRHHAGAVGQRPGAERRRAGHDRVDHAAHPARAWARTSSP